MNTKNAVGLAALVLLTIALIGFALPSGGVAQQEPTTTIPPPPHPEDLITQKLCQIADNAEFKKQADARITDLEKAKQEQLRKLEEQKAALREQLAKVQWEAENRIVHIENQIARLSYEMKQRQISTRAAPPAIEEQLDKLLEHLEKLEKRLDQMEKKGTTPSPGS
jgi:hypothetical protein